MYFHASPAPFLDVVDSNMPLLWQTGSQNTWLWVDEVFRSPVEAFGVTVSSLGKSGRHLGSCQREALEVF